MFLSKILSNYLIGASYVILIENMNIYKYGLILPYENPVAFIYISI